MKKFLLGLMVLLGLSAVFTGCDVHASVSVKNYGKYIVYLQNDSSSTVRDWKVIDISNNKEWKFKDSASYYYTVYPGETRGMSGLPGGYYYSVEYKIGGNWYRSSAFFLDEDKVLRVYDARTMLSEENSVETAEPEFKLVVDTAADISNADKTTDGVESNL